MTLCYYKKIMWNVDHGHLRRIEQVHPGQDGIVSVVNVHTKTGVCVRQVVKIYMLEECYNDKVPKVGEMLQKVPPPIVAAERELL